MHSTDKLKALLARCKAGVSIEVNDHRNVYETAEQAIVDRESVDDGLDLDPAVRAEMIRTNTIVAIQFYPDTPVGFYYVMHHDLDAALDAALECVPVQSEGNL